MMQMAFLGLVSSGTITAVTMEADALNQESASAVLTFNNDGFQSVSVNGSLAVIGPWVLPASTAKDWEVRATLTAGLAPTSGTLDSWLSLDTSRSWGIFLNSLGNRTSVLTFEFRKIGETEIQATTTNNLITAEVTGIF